MDDSLQTLLGLAVALNVFDYVYKIANFKYYRSHFKSEPAHLVYTLLPFPFDMVMYAVTHGSSHKRDHDGR